MKRSTRFHCGNPGVWSASDDAGRRPGCPGVARYIPRAAGQARGIRRAPRRVYFAKTRQPHTFACAYPINSAIRLRTAPTLAFERADDRGVAPERWSIATVFPTHCTASPRIRRPSRKPRSVRHPDNATSARSPPPEPVIQVNATAIARPSNRMATRHDGHAPVREFFTPNLHAPARAGLQA